MKRPSFNETQKSITMLIKPTTGLYTDPVE